jgi:hypothetical protein
MGLRCCSVLPRGHLDLSESPETRKLGILVSGKVRFGLSSHDLLISGVSLEGDN